MSNNTVIPTYDDMLKLVDSKLAVVSINNNLSTFKYAKRVMFDYLWKTNPHLLECRGITFDNTTKELVVAAPRKSFNYLEEGYWKDVPLATPVVAYVKHNGFLACVSKHNGEVVVSTTGSTKSDFVGYAKEMLYQLDGGYWKTSAMEELTDMYEIIHPSDPHIVAAESGAKMLGCRDKRTGHFYPLTTRLEVEPYEGTLKGILAIAELNQGEGFMVYRKDDTECLNCCKIKTPYYVGKKKLMRMGKNKVEFMYMNIRQVENDLPEYWKWAPLAIKQFHTKEEWIEMNDQQRRGFLENIDEYSTK